MTVVELNKKYYTVPEKWNELTGRQLLQVMEVLYGNYAVDTARLKLLKILTCMSWYRFFKTSMSQKSEFLYLCHFLVDESTLTNQLIPRYKGFCGPADDFNNLVMDEFVFCEDFYLRYAESEQEDETLLNELVAVLYRPAKENYNAEINPDGDTRTAFNENISHYNANKRIKHWPIPMKLSVLKWYQSCREKMMADNPDVFTGGSGEPAKYGMLSVIRTIAENGVHGDFDKVGKKYVKLIMMELNEKVEETKRMEKTNVS